MAAETAKPTETKPTEPEQKSGPEKFEPKTLYRGADEQARAETPEQEAKLRWDGYRSAPRKKTAKS